MVVKGRGDELDTPRKHLDLRVGDTSIVCDKQARLYKCILAPRKVHVCFRNSGLSCQYVGSYEMMKVHERMGSHHMNFRCLVSISKSHDCIAVLTLTLLVVALAIAEHALTTFFGVLAKHESSQFYIFNEKCSPPSLFSPFHMLGLALSVTCASFILSQCGWPVRIIIQWTFFAAYVVSRANRLAASSELGGI